MKISELKPKKGSVKRKKIVGKGPGSGHGKTATRGSKGQNSRTGGGVRPGFEGGQTPIYRRLPIRGFKSLDKIKYEVVNVGALSIFPTGTMVGPLQLKEKGLIKTGDLVKVLGEGECKVSLTVKANAFSKSAIDKIKSAGGSTEVL